MTEFSSRFTTKSVKTEDILNFSSWLPSLLKKSLPNESFGNTAGAGNILRNAYGSVSYTHLPKIEKLYNTKIYIIINVLCSK